MAGVTFDTENGGVTPENTLFLRISECAYDKLLVFEMQGLTPLNQIRL